jgi:hypothetical protein
MERMMVVLLALAAGCMESNPQPSPQGKDVPPGMGDVANAPEGLFEPGDAQVGTDSASEAAGEADTAEEAGGDAVTLELVPGCNPFKVTDACILPYPSLFYEQPDEKSPTGVRVHYPADSIPTPPEFPKFNMDPTNLADGVSPAGPILIHFGVDVAPEFLVGVDELGESLAAQAALALFDLETGERVLFLSEMDMNRKEAFPGRYVLIVRPMVPMAMGHRHVMALTTKLRDTEGGELPMPEAFRALRDGMATNNAEIEAVRGRFEGLFDFLADRGYPRGELLLAWDFSVASQDFLLGSVLSMREETLAETGAEKFGYVITKVEKDPNPNIARLVEGDFEAPTYLREDNTFAYDDKHHPVRQLPNRKFPFTLLVPKMAETRDGPLPLAVFGHGIFGTGRSYLAGWAKDFVHPLVQDRGVVMVATDWIGLSGGDQELIIQEVLPNLNRVALVTDRLQQSLVNNLTLTELTLGPLSEDPEVTVGDGPLLDPERVFYYGVSLGGIQGTSFVALSPRIQRGVLAVPGSVWLNMIPRSTVWIPIKAAMDVIYPDPLLQQMGIAFVQTWFDHSDPINLTYLLFDQPLPDARPGRTVIFQEAVGDSQVPNMCTEMLARARHVKQLVPPVYEAYGLEQVPAPTTEPVLVQYRLANWDKPVPPKDNVCPSKDNGVHSDMVFLPHVMQQALHFLETGEVLHLCDGPCDPE